jgi:hypothetical protein
MTKEEYLKLNDEMWKQLESLDEPLQHFYGEPIQCGWSYKELEEFFKRKAEEELILSLAHVEKSKDLLARIKMREELEEAFPGFFEKEEDKEND